VNPVSIVSNEQVDRSFFERPKCNAQIKYGADIIRNTISVLSIHEGDNDSKNMRFSCVKGTRRTDADPHPEHTSISSVSLTIRTSSDLRPTSTRIPVWAKDGTRTTRDLSFPSFTRRVANRG
jgi:hypothetical protein